MTASGAVRFTSYGNASLLCLATIVDALRRPKTCLSSAVRRRQQSVPIGHSPFNQFSRRQWSFNGRSSVLPIHSGKTRKWHGASGVDSGTLLLVLSGRRLPTARLFRRKQGNNRRRLSIVVYAMVVGPLPHRRPSVSRSVGRCSDSSEAKDRSESVTTVLSASRRGEHEAGRLKGAGRSARGRVGANSPGESPPTWTPRRRHFHAFPSGEDKSLAASNIDAFTRSAHTPMPPQRHVPACRP